jgi:hypothetical protein
MYRLSSRNNQLRFKTSWKWYTVSKGSMDYVSKSIKTHRKITTCNWSDLETLGFWPQHLSRHSRHYSESHRMLMCKTLPNSLVAFYGTRYQARIIIFLIYGEHLCCVIWSRVTCLWSSVGSCPYYITLCGGRYVDAIQLVFHVLQLLQITSKMRFQQNSDKRFLLI